MYLEYNPHIINNNEIRKISTNVTCIAGIRYKFKSDAKNYANARNKYYDSSDKKQFIICISF